MVKYFSTRILREESHYCNLLVKLSLFTRHVTMRSLQQTSNPDARSIYSTAAGDAIGPVNSCRKYYNSPHVIMINTLLLAFCPVPAVRPENLFQGKNPRVTSSYKCCEILTYYSIHMFL